MNVVLIGLGRMGLRHARALVQLGVAVTAVEPREEARTQAAAILQPKAIFESLDELVGRQFDAAIVAATADVRPNQFLWLLDHGVPQILLEKPLCQTRRDLHRMCAAAEDGRSTISVHLYRRTLPAFQAIRERCRSGGGPLHITVTSGASGLGANGIHWIDFALWLTGSDSGRLLFGELNTQPIASGRGSQFRDFGGTGIFELSGGSKLVLTILARSSASTSFAIYEDHHALIVDQQHDRGIQYDRDPTSQKPVYLYGQDHRRSERDMGESVDLSEISRSWLECAFNNESSPLPSLQEARVAHDLLFDLLESGGETEFHFT